MTYAEFSRRRQANQPQFLESPGASHTIMLCSHIWWADHIAFALLNAGYHILLNPPLYLLYTEDRKWNNFDHYWHTLLAGIKHFNVSLIIGGNTSAMALHPKTGELLHEAAGVPVIHYWWDELRARPPFASRGFSPDNYLRCLQNPNTLNAIWDLDVLEEMQTFFHLANTFHLPLATLPDFYPHGYVPMADRAINACFLGNCHFVPTWADSTTDPQINWARAIVNQKRADIPRPMRDCIHDAGPIPAPPANADPWDTFCRPWEILNGLWMHHTRNQVVKAAADHLKGSLALIGKGWEQLGLRPNAEHAGDKSGVIYMQSKASLNLFGGCVHGGLPLRPYDIAASGGLLVTHDQRELPSLFEPAKECLSFRSAPEMLDTLDRILKAPSEFDPIARAGRERVLVHHTWSHRIPPLLHAARTHLHWTG